MIVWRIGTDTKDYVADDMSGAGAKATGGRWNPIGTPVMYTASSPALACLETLVHLGAGSLPMNRYLIEITIPDGVWKRRQELDPARHVGWDAIPEGRVSLEAGSGWIAAAMSAVLVVPSVVVPEDTNILINPAHPDAKKIKASKRRKWIYDFRLVS